VDQLILELTSPRARRSDPRTSYVAAEKAASFTAKHVAKIFSCLVENGKMTPKEISQKTGLEYHAVQRRGKEMETGKLIVRGPEEKDGMRLWRVA